MQLRWHRDDRSIELTYHVLVPCDRPTGPEFRSHFVGSGEIWIHADSTQHHFGMAGQRRQMKSFGDRSTSNQSYCRALTFIGLGGCCAGDHLWLGADGGKRLET